MKGEYLDQHHNHQQHQNLPPIFSKHHHHHNQPPQPQLLPFSQHFHLSRDAEDDDTRSTATPSSSAKPHDNPNTSGGTDDATIEVTRRPRGRPPGSKNKPKPPVIITRDPEPSMNPYILEVPGGSDVVESIARFCRRKSTGICVLTGSGTVANVTLLQPSTTPGATITFHGRFDILSVSATFLPQTTTAHPVPNSFTISLAGPQGQIVGGIVAGGLVAAGTVYIIAASFNNPSYHRLPVDEEGRNSADSGGEGQGQGQSPAVSGGESVQHAPEGQSPGMYSCHMPASDVIWAPTPRPPPPPY